MENITMLILLLFVLFISVRIFVNGIKRLTIKKTENTNSKNIFFGIIMISGGLFYIVFNIYKGYNYFFM